MARSGYSGQQRWFVRSALGAVLALGVVAGGTMAPQTAFAAKSKSSKLAPSKGFVAVASPFQKTVDGIAGADAAAVAAARSELENVFAAIEKEDDRYFAGSLAVNLGGKINDPKLQLRGLKEMLASGLAGADEQRFNTLVGQLSLQYKEYAQAQQYLQRAVDLGGSGKDVQALLAETYIGLNQPAKGLAMLKSAIESGRASGDRAPDAWYRRGLGAAFGAKSFNDVVWFGEALIVDYPEAKNIGVAATAVRALGSYGSQDTLDLMRLIGRTKSFAERQDYIEYVQAADPRRLPGEVMDVINAGIASGGLKASDSFVVDAREQAGSRIAADKASLPGYERDARKAGASEATITGAADAFLSYGQAATAEDLYKIALTKPGVDTPRVLTRLGIAQVDQGKYAEAQENFSKVVGPRQPIARLWAAYANSKARPTSVAPVSPAAPQ